MSKTLIGFMFILAGVCYGSLAIDDIYSHTLGYLVAHNWVKPPAPSKLNKNILGRKPAIILYSSTMIIIGIFLLWNNNN